jgi:hypothetical protein
MNQYPSHSNTPEFIKNESNTKPVLYQPPKPEEMQCSVRAQLKADLKDFALFAVFAICAWLVISMLLTAVFGG